MNANVTGNNDVGALVGVVKEGLVSQSFSQGSVTAHYYSAGGLVGMMGESYKIKKRPKAEIIYSGSSARVKANNAAGGLVGRGVGGSIVASYATGDVTAANSMAGGLVGGIFGRKAPFDLTYGGGPGGSIVASYATGDVTGKAWIGGLMGLAWDVPIVASYSSSSLTGTEHIGGLVGFLYGERVYRTPDTITVGIDSYWDDTTVGTTTPVVDTVKYWVTEYINGVIHGVHPRGPHRHDNKYIRFSTGTIIGAGKTTRQLRSPTGYTGIYTNWNVDVDNADGDGNYTTDTDDPWDFGTSSQYPALKADRDGDGRATAHEFGRQGRSAATISHNRAPVYAAASATRSVAENTADGVSIGNPVAAADPDAGDTLTYTLGGTDQAHFAIDSASGQLQTKEALDYEDQSSYLVTVTATDGGGLTASIAVTIEVTDVTEAITPPAQQEVQGEPPGDEQPDAEGESGLEGQPGNVRLNLRSNGRGVRVIWDAPEEAGAETYYQVRRRLDLAGSDYAVIASRVVDANGDGEVRYRTESSELEAGQTYVYSVRAFAGDGQALGEWTEGVSITLPSAAEGDRPRQAEPAPEPVNQAPAYAAATATVSVSENTAANTNIGSPVTAADSDAGDTLTYTLGTTADDSHFAIDSATGQLQTQGALDYEGQRSYTVTVTATDGGGLSASIAVVINVTDVNEPPAYAGASATVSVAENTAAGTDIGDPVVAADSDAGDTLTYTLGTTADDGHFGIAAGSGQLQTQGALDYEGRSSYAVTVTATDGDGLSASIAVAINVTNVNEAPAYANASATVSVAENTAAGADIANPLTAADPDAGDTLTYTLGTTADDGHFGIDAGSGQLRTQGALDYEGKSSYSVTVTATDGGGLSDSIAVAISVTDVNEAPAYANASASLSVAENTATGADIGSPVTAADSDAGDTLTYTLGTTADDGHFGIDAGSGQLQTQGALDYEGKSSYAVTVTATDGGGLAASIAVTITVTDVADTPPGQPDAPEIINVQQTSFRVTWTAPAAGSSAITGYGIQYKLTSAADSAYADVKPTPTGTVTGYTLKSRSGQTVEKRTSYAVRVRASNAEGWGPWSASAVATTTGATPAPANEAPAYANAIATVSVAENTAAGTDIGAPVAATDPDGDSLTYTLGTTADDGHFAIDSASGQLQTNGPLDYEGRSSYAVTVTATDGGGLSASIAVAISVTNVNEAPTYATTTASVSVAENTATGADIGNPLTSADPDAGDTLTYTLGTTADDGHFAIDSATGQLQTKGALDYEGRSSYSVTVTATDDGGLSASIAVTVGVTDVAEQAAGPDLPEMSGTIFYARGRVTLLWDRVDGAKYYELLRDGAPLSKAMSTRYFDYPAVGADYEYRVTAYSASDVALATMAKAVSAG